MNDELIKTLVALAKKTAWNDDADFCVDDYAAGNEDDAYYGGVGDGEIELARTILNSIGVNWNE